MKEPRHFHNLEIDDPCEVCFNEGWVVIKGFYRVHGYSYSRGSAPCRWCDIGKKTFEKGREKRLPITDNYTIDHVDGYDPHVEYLPKAEARRLIKELLAGMHTQSLDEMDPETRRLVELQIAARERNYAPPPREDIRP